MSREGNSVVFDLPDEDDYSTSNWLENGFNMKPQSYQHSEQGASMTPDNVSPAEAYCRSSKGQQLTKGLSAMYGLTMVIIGLALMLSKVLMADNVDVCDTSYFYFYMYMLSSVSILVILILGSCDKLSNDEQYKDQKTVTFIRIGAVVLGTGGLIYEAINILVFANCPAECQFKAKLLSACSAIVFMVLEITLLLNYSRVRINYGTWLGVCGQLICMQITATNLCVWVQTVVFETVEDIESQETRMIVEQWLKVNFTDEIANDTSKCDKGQELQHLLAPYLFPFLIEYSVIAAIMVIAIWEKCGTTGHLTSKSIDGDSTSCSDSEESAENGPAGPRRRGLNNRRRSDGQVSVTSFTDLSSSRMIKPHKYYNNHFGFIIGWVVVCVSIVAIIAYLFVIYAAEEYGNGVETTVYSLDVIINLLCLGTIVLTMYKMSELTWKDQEIKLLRKLKLHHSFKFTTSSHIHRDLDTSLLNVTFVALMVFFMFVMISAEANDSALIFANALFSVLMGGLQTMFINWFGFYKRSTELEHLENKPGRQGLEIIRCCNLALWAFNTFVIKHPENKQIHKETFGFTAWVIISNITQPLTILFYFHSAACVAEIISHSYTHKYVGIRRSSLFDIMTGEHSTSDIHLSLHDSEVDAKHPNSASAELSTMM